MPELYGDDLDLLNKMKAIINSDGSLETDEELLMELHDCMAVYENDEPVYTEMLAAKQQLSGLRGWYAAMIDMHMVDRTLPCWKMFEAKILYGELFEEDMQ